MAYAYVYAPFTGSMWAQAYYCYCCGGGAHTGVDQCCPIDDGRNDGATPNIYFYGSSNIKSIRTTYENFGVCLDTAINPPWDALLRVEFFSAVNAQNLIGIVAYAHINAPVANGVYNTRSMRIGTGAPNTCGCSCYQGAHVHMERDIDGISNSFSCGAQLYAGSTWLYKWIV